MAKKNKKTAFQPPPQAVQTESEVQLENLLLRAEDLSGWTHWDSSEDPRMQVFKNFLRTAIEPLLEEIADLKRDISSLEAEIAEMG